MAISKEKKDELVNQYVDWINNSRAIFLTEYKGLTMKDLDELRQKAREVGGEYHIVKNTLSEIAFRNVGLQIQEDTLIGTTAIGFAFEDAPGMAKVIAEKAKESDFITVKCGYLNKEFINSADVIELAELPPLPVMRARLLGTLLEPANKLVRTLAEPARQITTVIKAFSELESVQANG